TLSAPAGSRPQNGGTPSTTQATSSFSAPRHDAPRGGPRAALAPAAAPGPIARRVDARPDAPPLTIARFEDLIALAGEKRDLSTKAALERDVRLVRFEDGKLELALEPTASRTLIGDLSRKLSDWTGRRWIVVVSAEQGQPSLKSQNEARHAELLTRVRADPLVQAGLIPLPRAAIVAVRPRGAVSTGPSPFPPPHRAAH